MNGAGLKLMQLNQLPKVNNHFIAHIIRDTFSEKNFTVIYGNDTTLRDTLLLPEHSIGAFQMHSDQGSEIKYDNCEFWNIGLDNPHISYGDVDLFISINYNPELQSINKDKIATQIKNLLKPKAKKDCGCQGNDPIAAINAMSDADLKEQIAALGDKRRLDDLTSPELKAILIELIQK